MTIDHEHFKKKLEAENKLVEAELEKVGRRNPDNKADWEAIPEARDISQADENTVADGIEDYETNIAIVNTLETRYKDIKNSLEKIKGGTYGMCQVCGEEIDAERLEANPSATTCRKHME